MQRIDFRELAKKAEGARLEEIRQSVARLQTDNEKIDLLIQVAGDVQKDNKKLAIQVLDEAKQIVNHRAASYENFEQQLKVAHAFASVDATRSFEVMEPGISQLNELLQAASVLSGFEINMFRDGEMAIQNGNGLTAILNRYGQELAVLARNDFERSETLTGRFQFTEPRIMTRLAIVQGLLDVKPVTGGPRTFGNFGENIVIRP
jgi:phage host-nuclease inhibitor protein Gam